MLGGEFNLERRVDADDFSPIDSNYGHAQTALAMVAASPLAGAELSTAAAVFPVNTSAWEGLLQRDPNDVQDVAGDGLL